MAKILILGVKVPFTHGGQEVLVGSLRQAIKARGHEVDTVELPFNVFPKDAVLVSAAHYRELSLDAFAGCKVDLVIGTKFPSYLARHEKKVLWLVHQRREAYDLYGSQYSDIGDDPRDEALRRMLHEADTKALSECVYRSTISQTVARRLKEFNGLSADVLYPPLPLGNRYKQADSEKRDEEFILYVGRICSIKRIDLMIKAMPMVHHFVQLKIVGSPDEPTIMEYLKNEIAKHHLQDRVQFLGRVSDEDLLNLYRDARAVYYAPHNEDYGYVTLEAMASGVPVITGHDSGGTLEFVRHEETGLIVEPTLDAISKAANAMVEDRERAHRWGQTGRKQLQDIGLTEHSWDALLSKLLAPAEKKES